jgi:hypothetical protein
MENEKKVHEVIFGGEEKITYPVQPPNKMAEGIIKHSFGFVKNGRQANTILIIFVIILFCATAVILLTRGKNTGNTKYFPIQKGY